MNISNKLLLEKIEELEPPYERTSWSSDNKITGWYQAISDVIDIIEELNREECVKSRIRREVAKVKKFY